MRALQEAAIRVPEDISIIGFNDISVAKYVSPTLTTVKVHTEWMGELAVETMKELCLNPQFLENYCRNGIHSARFNETFIK